MTLLFADILDAQAYDSTVDTPAQQLCEGVLVQKDDTAIAKRQTGRQFKTQLIAIYSTDQRQGIMRLRFKRIATAFIASIDRGSASFEPR